MKKISAIIKGMTRTQKIIAASTLISVAVLATIGAFYGIKQIKIKKIS